MYSFPPLVIFKNPLAIMNRFTLSGGAENNLEKTLCYVKDYANPASLLL